MTVSSGRGGGGATYELTVLGPLGPVLRAALPGDSFETVEAGTVVHVLDSAGRDLVDLVALCESAGVVVRGARRLSG